VCAHNVFLEFFYCFGSFYECLKILEQVFFTAYSVDVGDFYRILSRRRRFFTAYSVDVGDFLPHTQ
jgi:hypothetical protein